MPTREEIERMRTPERLALTRGLPLHTIASMGLLRVSDWVLFAGAIYPDKTYYRMRAKGKLAHQRLQDYVPGT